MTTATTTTATTAFGAAPDARPLALARALLGVYLALHFGQLLPYAGELFGDGAMFDAAASPFFGRVPNPLFAHGALAGVLVVAAAALSLALAAGLQTRLAALGLWLAWGFLYTRNPLIANPGMPYVGWILLALAAGADAPRHAPHLRRALFALLMVGYSYSALTKLASPSWVDGSALGFVLDNPLARPNALRELLLAAPGPLVVASYATLALELLAAPLSLSRRLRPFLWLALTGMHLGILTLVDFADLTGGMLIAHAFAFDPAWLQLPLVQRVRALART